MSHTNNKEVEEKSFEEYAYQVKRTTCQSILDHGISWCGDCYACHNCGKVFIWAGVANETLHQELQKARASEREKYQRLIDELLSYPPPSPDNREACQLFGVAWRAMQKMDQSELDQPNN